MAGHALDLDGGVDELLHLRVSLVLGFQLRRDLQRPVQGHLQLHGNHLGDGVHLGVGHAQHPAHVTDGGAGGHGPEGDDLSHMVVAVFLVHIVDDLLPALVAEVHVEIGHAHPFGVQKALEQKVVADGVDVGDAHAVSREAARAAAAAGAHGDALLFCVVDEVEDDEVIVGVAHAADDADLVFQTLAHLVGHAVAVAAHEALAAELFEIDLVVHAVRRFEIRQLGDAELKVKVAHLGDLDGVLAGVRRDGEQVVHLLGALEVELVGLEFQLVRVLHGLAGLDADENALHLAVLLAEVVGVVGGHQRDARLPGKADEQRQNLLLRVDAMVLNFNVEVALTEQVVEIERGGLCLFVVPRKQRLGYLARKAGGKTHQTLVVLFQQFLVHPGFGVKALDEAGGDQLDEVFVARFVFAKQHQMVGAVDAVHLVKAGAGGHIDLAADDGLHAGLFGGLVKVHAAVHHAVVGDGDGGLAQLLEAVEHAVDAAGAVQQAVFRVHMQVHKLLFRHRFSFAAVHRPAAPAFSACGKGPIC